MNNKRFQVISAWENVGIFIKEASLIKEDSIDHLWDKYLIEPYWSKVIEWAPGGYEDRKPKPIKDLVALQKQLDIFDNSNIMTLLNDELIKIWDSLPINDEDVITIALYPLSPENKIVAERQNGVVGSCVFGNILVNINPLANDWIGWVPYVIAHEYHHGVWGYNNIVLKGKYQVDLLSALLNEGQADTFAKTLYKDLKPSWLNPISRQQEIEAWKLIKSHLSSCDPEINERLMFGDEKNGIPWCIGYLIGNNIIHKFLENKPKTTFMDLINMDPEYILFESGYDTFAS